MEVFLRAFEMDDYLLIHKWRMDDEIWNMTTGNSIFVSSGREKQWVENKIFDDRKDLYCAACLTENLKMIGYVSLLKIDHLNKNALLGIVMGDKENRSVKNSAQAMFLMLKHGFEQLGLHRISGEWLEGNDGALFLAKMLGFKEEGLIRQSVFKKNKFNNIIIGSVLREEFEGIKDKVKF